MKERNDSVDSIDKVLEGMKPGVEVTASLLTPIVKNLAATGEIFVRDALVKNPVYRKVVSHLL